MSDVEAIIDGESITTWTSVDVGWSVEHVANSFELGVVAPIGNGAEVMANAKNKTAEILLDGATILTGFVFKDARSFDANALRIGISGRSLAADVVDCSVISKRTLFRDVDFKTLAEALLERIDLPLRWDADPGKPFHRFKVEQGETAFTALDRACRLRGVFMMADPDGAIRFAKVATGPAFEVIEVGSNALSGGSERDGTDQFSDYHFRGQTTATDTHFGEAAALLQGVAVDPRVLRYRPRLMMAGQGHREDPGARALWERNRRYGQSERHWYQLDGWLTSRGALWAPNQLVQVIDPLQHVDGELLVASVRLTLNEQDGAKTVVEACPPEAFQVAA